jgi:V/A-type H+/Na+-transporting ATPase subunit I
MRVDVNKFLCLGANSQRDQFFAHSQKLGVVEFIDSNAQNSSEWPSELQEMQVSYKMIHSNEKITQKPLGDNWTPGLLTEHILTSKKEEEHYLDELRQLKLEIARIEPFGDFSKEIVSDISVQGNYQLYYFFSKKISPEEIQEYPNLIHINSMHGLEYYLSISKDKIEYEGLVEVNIPIPLGMLQRKYLFITEKLHAIKEELLSLEKYSEALMNSLIERLDEHQLHVNKEFVSLELDETLFYVEAWVPKHQLGAFQGLLDKYQVHAEEIAIESKDKPPTFLDNQGLARIGEDVIRVYDTPSHEDKDSSTWVLWSFAAFFAFIISDAGYGFMILLISVFLYIKFPNVKGVGRRFFHLCAFLSLFCIVWGVLANSFFGIDISLKNPIRKVSLVQWMSDKKSEYLIKTKNDNYQEWVKRFPKVAHASTAVEFYEATKYGDSFVALGKFANSVLLELSLVMGVVHLILSFLRRAKEHWAGFGWILFMVGSYLCCPIILKSDSMLYYILGIVPSVGAAWGLKMLVFGMCFALVIALVQHKAKGASEFMNVIQVFADVLSYLRLFALALAGGMMSSTFNSMGAEAGWFFGFFIIVIGQIINFSLSILGGVIHGLRLNFLEWYHYCFDGGGKLFNPLTLLKRH